MKKIIFFIIFLVINIKANSQEMSSQTNTTLSTNESVSTENNITKINLFNIDYNGTKIPINIVYSHNGLKVADTPNSIGYGWNIQDLGFIRSIVNHRKDTSPNNGWFNSAFPDFSNFSYEDSCESCPNFSESVQNDLSPDYFSLNLTNGIQFDFLYKKTVSGTTVSSLTPVILSNSDNYKINTNFNNFYTTAGQQATSNIVFDIKDKFGNKYEFINGPIKQDSYRSPVSDFNNDYYLSFITNTSNKDSLLIEYNTYEEEVKKSYTVGFNKYAYSGNNATNNDDYQNNIIHGVTGDYFFIDKTRFNYKKIKSKNSTIEFVYNQDYFELLDEIKIYDNNNNYVSGYKFEYDQSYFLRKVSKYNNLKTESIIIYEFDYYQGQEFFNDLGVMEDYFGFYNGVYNSNPLPFSIRNANGTITPSGNLAPNLSFAKENMLYKIKNVYSGETEFDYSLNYENHYHYGNIYGGGLVIKSKKDSPIIGKTRYTQYNYQNLSGFVIFADSPGYQYIYQGQAKKYTSLNFTLDGANNGYPNETTLNSIHRNGNYFKDVTEFVYDYDSMLLEYKIVRTYAPNYEGLFRNPLLKKETHYNNSNSKVKEIELEYDYTTSETITRADYRTEKRRVGQVT